MKRRLAALALLALYSFPAAAQRFGVVQADRLEYREHEDKVFWDIHARYGGDYHSVWLKAEGESNRSPAEYAELQLLYSRAWTAYLDLQFGLRVQEFSANRVAAAVAGMHGLLPYRINVDTAAFFSEHGDVSVRAEFARDIRLKGHLILQPRMEINIALDDAPEFGLSRGVSELAAGLRLRFEITPRIAPYVGASWHRVYGSRADFTRSAGETIEKATLLAGARFRF